MPVTVALTRVLHAARRRAQTHQSPCRPPSVLTATVPTAISVSVSVRSTISLQLPFSVGNCALDDHLTAEVEHADLLKCVVFIIRLTQIIRVQYHNQIWQGFLYPWWRTCKDRFNRALKTIITIVYHDFLHNCEACCPCCR